MDDVTVPIVLISILNQQSRSLSSGITEIIEATAIRLVAHLATQDPAAVATKAAAVTVNGAIAVTATEATEVEVPMVLLRGRSSPLVDGVSPTRDHHRNPVQLMEVENPLDQDL